MFPTTLGVIGEGLTSLGHGVFIAVHLLALLVGAFFAYRAFGAGPRASRYAWAFTLFVLAEISYLGYHFEITHFLLSHTISEVLNLVAFILVFSAISSDILSGRDAGAAAGA